MLNKLKILGFSVFFFGFAHFCEVFVDLIPKVDQILPKVAPNPWGFGFGLMGPSL